MAIGRSLSMSALINDGLLSPGEKLLTFDYMGKRYEADLLPEGTIRWNGNVYTSPYAWASQCKNSVNPDHKTGIGWGHIRYMGIKLSQFKNMYLKKHKLIFDKDSSESTSVDPPTLTAASNQPVQLPRKPRKRKQQHAANKAPPVSNPVTVTPGVSSETTTTSSATFDHETTITATSSSSSSSFSSSGTGLKPSPSSTASNITAGTTNRPSAHSSTAAGTCAFIPSSATTATVSSSGEGVSTNSASYTCTTDHESGLSVKEDGVPSTAIAAVPMSVHTSAEQQPDIPEAPNNNVVGSTGGAGRIHGNAAAAMETLTLEQRVSDPTANTMNNTNTIASSDAAYSSCGTSPVAMAAASIAMAPVSMPTSALPSAVQTVQISRNPAVVSDSVVPKLNPDTHQLVVHSEPLLQCLSAECLGMQQPFAVYVSSNVLLLMDFHSHLALSEVVGYLGGQIKDDPKEIAIQQAFPCQCDTSSQEEGTKMEAKIRELMGRRGQRLVGWYHSHPVSEPRPSEMDVILQQNYQETMKSDNGENPCVALIISPNLHGQLENTCSQTKGFWVHSFYGSGLGSSLQILPLELSFSVAWEQYLTQEVVDEMGSLIVHYKQQCPTAPNFSSTWKDGVSLVQKLKESLSAVQPKFPQENSDETFMSYIEQLVLQQ